VGAAAVVDAGRESVEGCDEHDRGRPAIQMLVRTEPAEPGGDCALSQARAPAHRPATDHALGVSKDRTATTPLRLLGREGDSL